MTKVGPSTESEALLDDLEHGCFRGLRGALAKCTALCQICIATYATYLYCIIVPLLYADCGWRAVLSAVMFCFAGKPPSFKAGDRGFTYRQPAFESGQLSSRLIV